MAGKPKSEVFFDARGRVLVERRGLPRSLREVLGKDTYHLMRTASWGTVTTAFFGLFISINLVFATVLWVTGAEISKVTGFLDYFWFSVQTLGTIGYGGMTPLDTLGNAVVTVESFCGMVLSALITGVFFARFSTPTARIIFSKVAIISEHDGKRVFMFRMGNARSTAIVEATIRVYVTRDEQLASGERVRRIYDLALRRSTSPIFNLSWVAYHDIDAASPLAGCTTADMTARGMNIIVTFQGIDDRLAATVHTRYAYSPEDVAIDHRFVDIFRVDPDSGKRFLDFTPFHDTVPVDGVRPTTPA